LEKVTLTLPRRDIALEKKFKITPKWKTLKFSGVKAQKEEKPKMSNTYYNNNIVFSSSFMSHKTFLLCVLEVYNMCEYLCFGFK
jgi:hypothetical protein